MNPKELRIVFMGTPEFAVPSLRALVAGGYNVVAVVTTPDKPAGRGQKLHQSEVKLAALELGLPVLQPEKLKAPEFVEAMQALKPDLGIVIAFRMLPEVIWAMPRLGTFNLHASLLPQYRGAAPINWAVINGETETGVTTFLLNHEIDKGAIIAQVRVPILPKDNVGTMYDKLMHTGTALVTETVDRIAAGDVQPMEQTGIDESRLHPAPKIFKEDCRIDWSWEGRRIVNFVRGLSPYPAAWTEMRKEGETTSLTAKIYAAAFEAAAHNEAAGAVESDGRTFIRVACADGWITLGELQIAGKKRLPVRELLLGLREIGQYRFQKYPRRAIRRNHSAAAALFCKDGCRNRTSRSFVAKDRDLPSPAAEKFRPQDSRQRDSPAGKQPTGEQYRQLDSSGDKTADCWTVPTTRQFRQKNYRPKYINKKKGLAEAPCDYPLISYPLPSFFSISSFGSGRVQKNQS